MKIFITLALGGKHKYHSNLPQYINPRISRVKITTVIYRGKKFYKIVTRCKMVSMCFRDRTSGGGGSKR